VNINHWQRLQIANGIVDQNGFPQGSIQNYLGAQWLGVRPFALTRTDATKPWIDPGPPPYFAPTTRTQFVNEVVAVMTAGSQLSRMTEPLLIFHRRPMATTALVLQVITAMAASNSTMAMAMPPTPSPVNLTHPM